MIEFIAEVGRWGWFTYTALLALSEGLDLLELLVAIFMIGYLGGWIWWMVIIFTLSFLSGFFKR